MTLFDLFDYTSSNILLPVGGMIISVFVGWVLDRSVVKGELTAGGGRITAMGVRCVVFCLRWLAPYASGSYFSTALG